jgi:hypothetical protein
MKQFQAIVGATVIVLCGAAAPTPAGAENVLRWASAGGAATADPHAFDEVVTVAQLRQVYEQLVQFDSTWTSCPDWRWRGG